MILFFGAGNACGTPPWKSRGLYCERDWRHMAVHAPLIVVLEPLDWRVQSHTTTLTPRPGTLRETSSEFLCPVRVEEVDGGHIATGNVCCPLERTQSRTDRSVRIKHGRLTKLFRPKRVTARIICEPCARSLTISDTLQAARPGQGLARLCDTCVITCRMRRIEHVRLPGARANISQTRR